MERTARFFFFVRPRRFGKSLFLNILEYYYDCLAKDNFEELFGTLYVGKHPTQIRNSYLVLKMSFSGITANPEKMENDFEHYGCLILDGFARKYRSLFSAVEIAKTDNFKNLLFYYGMLTVSRVEMGDLFLAIPNQVVREQLYGYLADVYKDVASLELDLSELNQLMKRMAYLLEWENYFRYIAHQLKAQSSIREFIEGEAHVKGFLLSYMGMNNYYMTFPEYEMNKVSAISTCNPIWLNCPICLTAMPSK